MTPPTNGPKDPIRLRFEFVDMLFALAVGEVATHVSALAKSGMTILAARSAYANLAVAVCLVATSWIGWSNSQSAGHGKAATKVFGLPFVLLGIDVVLVVFYYIIAQGVEMPFSVGGQLVIAPSATSEAFLVFIVFVTYLLWDFISRALMGDEKFSKNVRVFAARGWISFLCSLPAAYLWLALAGSSEGNANRVVCIDIMLIAIIFLFRAIKEANRRWIWTCGAGFVVGRLVWHYL